MERGEECQQHTVTFPAFAPYNIEGYHWACLPMALRGKLNPIAVTCLFFHVDWIINLLGVEAGLGAFLHICDGIYSCSCYSLA